jgi:hypothetical protein
MIRTVTLSILRVVFLATVTVLGTAGAAHSATITIAIPEFSGPLPIGTFPRPAIDAGQFVFAVPVDDIVSATVSGTFGNSQSPSSSGVDVFFDGVMIAQCVPSTPCTQTPGPDAWSYAFNDPQIDLLLSDGLGLLTAVQTGPVFIRLGSLKLTLETPSRPVPEPMPAALLATGLLLTVVNRTRRKYLPR